jgi:hemoglobin/transferrin/lactoferrin receptor protein
MLKFYAVPFSVASHTHPGVVFFLRCFGRICWVSCLFLLFYFPAFAQRIQGQVTHAKTGKALDNVNVAILNTSLLTVTDREGKFSITLREKSSSDGTYTLRVSAVGFDAYEQRIEIDKEAENNIRIALPPSIVQLNKALVVSPRRQETAQFDLPEAISVRTNQQLQQDAPRTAPEALTGTTGVWLQKTNHGGGSPFLRGLTGQQTLLMIDGIRLNNASFRSGPNQYLNTIDPQSIYQIEALRGSGSVQYGSDALGGVVHVLTRDPQFSGNGLRLTGSAYAKVMSADMEKAICWRVATWALSGQRVISNGREM